MPPVGLAGAVGFEEGANTTLGAGGHVLVVDSSARTLAGAIAAAIAARAKDPAVFYRELTPW
jgi:hypothetical protein